MDTLAVFLLLCLLLAAWAQRLVYRRSWDSSLSVSLRFEKPFASEGELVKLFIEVRNEKRLPLLGLTVHYELPVSLAETSGAKYGMSVGSTQTAREVSFALPGNACVQKTVLLRCGQRGSYALSNVRIVSRSLLLDECCESVLPVETRLTVYPAYAKGRHTLPPLRKQNGSVPANDFYLEDRLMIRGVRDSQPFDSIRQINWNATAKTGKLMTNVYEHVNGQNAVILLNLSPDAMLRSIVVEEESIRLAKSYCRELWKAEDEASGGSGVRLFTNVRDADSGRLINVEQGRRHRKYMTEVNEALAKMDAENVAAEPFWELMEKQLKRQPETAYVVISADQHDAFQEGLLRFNQQGIAFWWILPVCGSSRRRVRKELKRNTVLWDVNWKRAC